MVEVFKKYLAEKMRLTDEDWAVIEEKGTRPLRYPLDAIAQGTDVEFINARAEIKKRWVAKYS